MNPFVIDKGDSEELLQRIGSLRRLIEVMVGEGLGAERRAALDHALAGYYAQAGERTGFRDFYAFLELEAQDLSRLLRPFATGSLRNLLSDEGDDLLGSEALVTVFDLRLLEPELRPAAAMVCTETVWAAAAQDPKPRLLVVDEVWSIMQHPEGAAFMVSMAKRARKHRLGLQFITQDVQDLLSEDSSRTITGHSGRALLQNAAFKLLLQQDAAAIGTVGDAFDLPEDLQRWLLSCPRGDGLLLAEGTPLPCPHRGHAGGDGGDRVEAGPPLGAATQPSTQTCSERSDEIESEPDSLAEEGQGRQASRAAGGDAAAHGGADHAGRGEHAPVHRRPRALLPGAGRGRQRGDPDGPAAWMGRWCGARSRPTTPRPASKTCRRRRTPLRLDGGRAGVGHDAPGRRPRVRPPAHLPGTTTSSTPAPTLSSPCWARSPPSTRGSASWRG